MNKELARYFVKLTAENLQFSFNGMGIPSYSCEWLENQFIQENFNEIEEFIKKRYDEHENSAKDTNVRGKKRKHKLRAMTNGEFCISHTSRCISCPILFSCPVRSSYSEDLNKPYQTKDGKYILIEVKE